MYLITSTRKAAVMSLESSFVPPIMCTKHRVAPLSVTGLGSTSAFRTVGSPVTGSLVIADAAVRDAKQAAPPRGQRC
jgi:hypothetical protein